MTRDQRSYRDRYNPGGQFESPNPSRLYRSRNEKMLAGVLGGISERFGWEVTMLRLLVVVTALFSGVFPVLIGYIIAAMIIPYRPAGGYERVSDPEDTEFWREVSDRPRATFRSVKYKFMDLEERLRSLESSVTSDEWRLRKAFRDLEKK